MESYIFAFVGGAINTLFGFSVNFLKNPYANWKLQLIILSIVLFGSFIGARISAQMDEQKLKKGFGWFVLVVGIVILIERSI